MLLAAVPDAAALSCEPDATPAWPRDSAEVEPLGAPAAWPQGGAAASPPVSAADETQAVPLVDSPDAVQAVPLVDSPDAVQAVPPVDFQAVPPVDFPDAQPVDFPDAQPVEHWNEAAALAASHVNSPASPEPPCETDSGSQGEPLGWCAHCYAAGSPGDTHSAE